MPKRRLNIDIDNELALDEAEERLGLSYSDTVNYLIEYTLRNGDAPTFDQYAFEQMEERIEPEEDDFDETTDLFRGINENEEKTFEDVLDDIDSLGEP